VSKKQKSSRLSLCSRVLKQSLVLVREQEAVNEEQSFCVSA